VLDDADLTGQGVSSAEDLGIPAAVIADRLTEHLIAQIKAVGLSGGPLKLLADQLNHDRTHQQARRSSAGFPGSATGVSRCGCRPGPRRVVPAGHAAHRRGRQASKLSR
jgi:hypothetical protein